MTKIQKRYTGQCHCGAISFTASLPQVKQAMHCDCSICRRKGIAMSMDLVALDDLTTQDDQNLLRTYQFGTMTARHHFCGRCGIHVFVETRLNPGHFRINLGCIDDIDLPSIAAETYDGRAL